MNIKEIYKYIENAEDLGYIKEKFIEFCRNQNVKNAILKSVEFLDSGDYDNIRKIINDSVNSGMDRNIGHVYMDMIDDRYSKGSRHGLIETEWGNINEITNGGMGSGDLFIVVGPSGGGKSWVLISTGLHALTLGKNVLHYTFELNEVYTGIRYDSRLSGIPSQNIKYHIDELKTKMWGSVKGKLIIKDYPTKAVGVQTLRSHANMLINLGFKPDLIIVDSGDNLRSDNIHEIKRGSYYESGGIYEDLRCMAGEFNVPLLTCSQVQRSAVNEDIITGDQIAESYKKIMVGDFIISLARKVEDKLAGTARLYVIKNRYGVDGLTFPSKIDVSVGKMEIFRPDSTSGTTLRKQMANSNELTRQELSLKYNDFKKEKNNETNINSNEFE